MLYATTLDLLQIMTTCVSTSVHPRSIWALCALNCVDYVVLTYLLTIRTLATSLGLKFGRQSVLPFQAG